MVIPYQDLSPDTKCWIFQSNRLISVTESQEIENLLNNFIDSWTAHGKEVYGYATIKMNAFVTVFADEEKSGVSGCSIDKLTKLIEHISQKFGLDLFNRFNLAYLNNKTLTICNADDFSTAIHERLINADTIVFNNSISNKKMFEKNWQQTFINSWQSKHFRHAAIRIKNL